MSLEMKYKRKSDLY